MLLPVTACSPSNNCCYALQSADGKWKHKVAVSQEWTKVCAPCIVPSVCTYETGACVLKAAIELFSLNFMQTAAAVGRLLLDR